jgi:hypothetical protein
MFIKSDYGLIRKYDLRKDEQNRILFGNIRPGKYSLYTEATKDIPAAKLDFEVPDYFLKEDSADSAEDDITEKEDAGNEKVKIFHDVTLPLKEGGRIVFHLSDEMKVLAFSSPWIGYRLTNTEEGKPVLEDGYGPYWGGVLDIDKDILKDVALTLPPGKYSLEAVLRDGRDYMMSSSDKNLWTYFSNIEIKKDESISIEIAQ